MHNALLLSKKPFEDSVAVLLDVALQHHVALASFKGGNRCVSVSLASCCEPYILNHLYTHKYTYIYIYIHIYLYTYLCIYTHTHTLRTHVHIQESASPANIAMMAAAFSKALRKPTRAFPLPGTLLQSPFLTRLPFPHVASFASWAAGTA